MVRSPGVMCGRCLCSSLLLLVAAASPVAAGDCANGSTGPDKANCASAEAGPGTGMDRLNPVVIVRKGKARTYSIDISAIAFADPRNSGERAFNAAVAALYADAPLDKTVDFDSAGELTYHLAVKVTWASPAFISATGEGWRYDGGAHDNSWTRAVNVDLRNGRLLTFANLFPASALPVFVRLCSDQLIAQKRAKMDSSAASARRDLAGYKAAIASYVGDLAHWSFFKSGAEVTFDAYVAGSYVEGDYTCHLAGDVIKRYADARVMLPH